MRNVRRHVTQRRLPSQFEEGSISCHVELKNSTPVLKSLGPLGPPARRVFAALSKDGSASGGIPTAVQIDNLCTAELQETVNLRFQLGRVDPVRYAQLVVPSIR